MSLLVEYGRKRSLLVIWELFKIIWKMRTVEREMMRCDGERKSNFGIVVVEIPKKKKRKKKKKKKKLN